MNAVFRLDRPKYAVADGTGSEAVTQRANGVTVGSIALPTVPVAPPVPLGKGAPP